MKHTVTSALVVTAVTVSLAIPAAASDLSKLGKSLMYPVQKTFHNAGHDVSRPVKSVTGPINQAGQSTTRSLHKVVPR